MSETTVFMDALYGSKPADSWIVLSAKNGHGWGQSGSVATAAEAAGIVEGSIDTYSRISVVGTPPETGRGTAAASVAIPGVWVEVDVNGSPNGRGGVITGAFENLEHGIDVARSVLPLSLGVHSGYGAHVYTLFDEPWLLKTDEDRAAAKALVKRYQAAVRAKAKAELGVSKLDSTYDLARVFRPPGSFNRKGDTPVPVTLLFADEPRIPVAEMTAAIPAPESKKKAAKRSAKHATSARQLLADHPTLASILASRKQIGDGSPSDRDYHLLCEALRLGVDDDANLETLIRHARAGNPKGERRDYINGTIAAARAAQPVGGGQDDDADHHAGFLSRLYKLEADPIVAGEMIGAGDEARVHLTRRSGARMALGPIGELFESRKHIKAVTLAAHTRFPLTPNGAIDAAQRIVLLCGAGEPEDVQELVAGWTGDFMQAAGAEVDAREMDTPEGRFAAVDAAKRKEAELPTNAPPAQRACLLVEVDADRRRWLPAGRFRGSLAPGAPTWGKLDALMTEAGWERRRVDEHTPVVPRSDPGSQHRSGVYYLEPRPKTP